MSTIPRLATLAQFINAAESQGCKKSINKGRVVLKNAKTEVPYILPKIERNEYLTQSVIESACRVLEVEGFTAEPPKKTSGSDWQPTSEEEN
jgi:hypothetical protein